MGRPKRGCQTRSEAGVFLVFGVQCLVFSISVFGIACLVCGCFAVIRFEAGREADGAQ